MAPHQVEETRSQILDAAIACFAREGFSATSTRSLAAEASVNSATLAYHFGSKQGVYDAAVAEVYERFGRSAAELSGELGAMNGRQRLAAVYALARRESAATRLLLREILDHGQLRDETVRAHFLPSVEQNAAALASLLGVEPTLARQAMTTMSFLIGRIAVQSEDSLMDAYGTSDASETQELIVDHLLAIWQTLTET